MKGEASLKNSLMTNIGDMLGLATDISIGELAPFIGEAIQSIKIRKLAGRLDACEDKVKYLSDKVKVIDDEKFVVFLKEFMFPSILQALLEEEEDKKTGLFLDGFDTVIDRRYTEESKILIYYDILRELRSVEINYLISLSTERVMYQINNVTEDTFKPFFDSKSSDLQFFIEMNLSKYGLIKNPHQANIEIVGEEIRLEDVTSAKLTPFGYNFLNFFKMLEKYKV